MHEPTWTVCDVCDGPMRVLDNPMRGVPGRYVCKNIECYAPPVRQELVTNTFLQLPLGYQRFDETDLPGSQLTFNDLLGRSRNA